MTHTQSEDSTPAGEIVICQSDDALANIDVRLEEDTVWLSKAQLCTLCDTSNSNVRKHILAEDKLEEIHLRLEQVGWGI